MTDLPHAANFIPISKFRMFGIMIPGVSKMYMSGSSHTRIFICNARVMPGLAPTLVGLPPIRNVPLRIKLINDDLPTLGIPTTNMLELGVNCLWYLSLPEMSLVAVGKT